MRILVFISLLFFNAAVFAANPDEMLENSVLEKRAQSLGREIRCMVCQGESIEDSGAALAMDLRKAVREQLMQGKTDTEVLEYLRARYGDVVLLSPPVTGKTIMLWFAPFLVILAGGYSVFLMARRQ